MLRAMFSPIIRSTWLYLPYLLVLTQVAAISNEFKQQFQPIQDTNRQQLGLTLPDTVNSQVLMMMGENIARNT
jgi:hypothetical protein